MGMIVQPLVGSFSDKTWCRWGPYLYLGALVAVLVMAFLPNSGSLGLSVKMAMSFGLVMLMLLDTSINMAMQPFKMMVGDMVNEQQKAKAYSIQSMLCNAGSLVGYLFPYLFTWIGISNIAPEGGDSRLGDLFVLLRRGDSDPLRALYRHDRARNAAQGVRRLPPYRGGRTDREEQPAPPDSPRPEGLLADRSGAVLLLVRLPLHVELHDRGIAQNVWGTADTASSGYQEAGNWVGVLFAVQAVGSVLWAIVLPLFRRARTGYAVSLLLGAAGFVSTYFIHDQFLLFVSFLLIGCGWAAMLAMPFALLTNALSGGSIGAYLGLFNCTICLPQIIAAILGGFILRLVGGEQILMLVVAGASLLLAAVSVAFVQTGETKTNA